MGFIKRSYKPKEKNVKRLIQYLKKEYITKSVKNYCYSIDKTKI
tara:strand:- start:151 stop:282 length:132 start_codon:yes stop_codon:yes gene_type:complete